MIFQLRLSKHVCTAETQQLNFLSLHSFLPRQKIFSAHDPHSSKNLPRANAPWTPPSLLSLASFKNESTSGLWHTEHSTKKEITATGVPLKGVTPQLWADSPSLTPGFFLFTGHKVTNPGARCLVAVNSPHDISNLVTCACRNRSRWLGTGAWRIHLHRVQMRRSSSGSVTPVGG